MADNVTKAERSRIMAAVKATDTAPEMVVRRLVFAMGFRYRLHERSLPGTPDLVFRRLRKAINVNGCFWHMHACGRCRMPTANRTYWKTKLERNVMRDKRVRKSLRRMGWDLLIIWECELDVITRGTLHRRIRRFLSAPALPQRSRPGAK